MTNVIKRITSHECQTWMGSTDYENLVKQDEDSLRVIGKSMIVIDGVSVT